MKAFKWSLIGRREEDADEEPRAPEIGASAAQIQSVERLGERFPWVQSLALNLSMRSQDYEIEPTLNGRSFGPDARAFFSFKCKNVDCVDGGFDLSEPVEEMLTRRQPEATGRRVCQGWESKAQVNQRRCHYELNFRALAKYLD